MLQSLPEPIGHDTTGHDTITPARLSVRHLEILDGIARELMPAVWGLGVQCSVLRLPTDLTARERRFAEIVEQNVGRITRVLASVHDLVLAETDGLQLDARPADLAEICGDALAQLREAGIEDEILCEGDGSGAGVWDPERLAEAVSYLLECALHAGLEDGGVRLRWSGGPREIVLTVERPARPGEARPEYDPSLGEALGAGPEESVKMAVARRVILRHGGTLARSGTSRAIAYVAFLPRASPSG